MPCDTAGHDHQWPQAGLLIVENCEHYCGYCTEISVKPRKYASTGTLRTHVKGTHLAKERSHPNVTLFSSKGRPTTNYARFAQIHATETRASDNNRPIAPGTQTSVIQHSVSVDALIPSLDALSLMRDIHEQLHLQPLARGAFNLFVWRHILSKPIVNLRELARTVKPDTSTVPKDLIDAIVTLLNGCGDIIWPTHAASRGHLTRETRLLQRGYWNSPDSTGAKTGPVWLTDGFMTLEMRRKWQEEGDGGEPSSEMIVINSPLGRLLKIYVFCILQHSVVGPSGYERAAAADSAELLWQIVAADGEEMRKGPIGGLMVADADDKEDGGETHEETMARYREETGGRGGLPWSEPSDVVVVDLT